MSRSSLCHRSLALAVAAACTMNSSCGTILHPERIGQPPGRLDPGVVALDGVGLLLFLIPGAIAFAVDFYTGAIYLPPQYANGSTTSSGELLTIKVNPQTLTAERIEQILKEQTGRDVRLEPGTYSVARLDSVQHFDAAATRLAGFNTSTPANTVIFRCQSE